MHLILLMLTIFLINFSCEEKNNVNFKENKIINKTKTAAKTSQNISESNINILKSQYKFNLTVKTSVVSTFYHNTESYTQGLLYYKGFLYESTGQYGASSLQKIDPNTGRIVNKINFPKNIFAEGISLYKQKIYVLTWRENKCFIIDLKTFSIIDEVQYHGEGWGLESDGDYFIMTNGGSQLVYVQPDTFTPIKKIDITENGQLIQNVNELELIGDEIWANVYMTDDIIRINKNTGKVIQRLNFSHLRKKLINNREAETFNGIAFNYDKNTFYLTGKNWSKYFEIEIN